MKQKVAIIFGGRSAEFEISLNSASNICNALDHSRFDPVLIGIDRAGTWYYNTAYPVTNVQLLTRNYFEGAVQILVRKEDGQAVVTDVLTQERLHTFEVAFSIIHGTFGEDGTLQGFLKTLDIPFVGPDVLGSSVCMDKEVTKRLLRDKGIPVADFLVMRKHDRMSLSFEEAAAKLGLPLFIKPCNAGSSVGVSKVTDRESFAAAVKEAFLYDHKILVEEAVIGKEVECAILGNEAPQASVVGEIVPARDFYSYDAKYKDADGAAMKIPAAIDDTIAQLLRDTAVEAFVTTCCEGLSRVDFFLRPDNTFVLNEINTLPGFTEISMYPKLWESTGLPYTDLISRLIELALQRQERNKSLHTGNGN